MSFWRAGSSSSDPRPLTGIKNDELCIKMMNFVDLLKMMNFHLNGKLVFKNMMNLQGTTPPGGLAPGAK